MTELAAVLAPCDATALEQIAERIRAIVAEESRASGIAVTVSVGAHLGQPGKSFDKLLRCTDQALYRAKRGGRNRIVID